MNDKLQNKWEIKNMIEESLKNAHTQPSTETKERLIVLETNQDNFMKEIQEIKEMIKVLGEKFDCAIDKKADK
jgi:hypothetical protein